MKKCYMKMSVVTLRTFKELLACMPEARNVSYEEVEEKKAIYLHLKDNHQQLGLKHCHLSQ